MAQWASSSNFASLGSDVDAIQEQLFYVFPYSTIAEAIMLELNLARPHVDAISVHFRRTSTTKISILLHSTIILQRTFLIDYFSNKSRSKRTFFSTMSWIPN